MADAAGRDVPAGWLPDVGFEALDRFARAAARVVRRSSEALVAGPLALLGEWDQRYLQLAERMEANLRAGGTLPFPVLRWTAERLTRDDLALGLRTGLGLAIYFGHGRPRGWAGYRGVRLEHLVRSNGEPLGALLSVTCLTASRWDVGLSFSEAATLAGLAAGALGAIAPVNHLDNMRWMVGLAEALRGGERLLGPALVRAAPPEQRARQVYRILGDPLAPLVGAPAALRRAAKIWAPAPDESLS
jgi:hypothetical protein